MWEPNQLTVLFKGKWKTVKAGKPAKAAAQQKETRMETDGNGGKKKESWNGQNKVHVREGKEMQRHKR